ncbi:MAG: VCBS repeat-containing protein [Opitutaceae bacterium]|nr:VCBS repeat-containing protein [Opitutaceae bacterium]
MPPPLRHPLAVSSLLLLLACAGPARGANEWTDQGPGFAAGTLGNAGQNLHVNPRGELETIKRFDADGNGFLDLLFNSSHDSYHYLPATLATARADGGLQLANLGVDGSSRAIECDLNRDGFNELVFMPNRQNIQRNRSSLTIAWGAADGWSSSRLTRQLPVNGGFGAVAGLQPALFGDDDLAVGDLNRDGWPDLITINTAAWIVGQPAGRILRVFWGGRDGYILDRLQDLGVPNAIEVVVGEFGAERQYTAAVLTSLGAIQYLAIDPATGRLRLAETLALPAPADGSLPRFECMRAQPVKGGDRLWVTTRAEVLYQIEPAGQVRTHATRPASHVAVGRLDDDEFPDLVLTELRLVYPADPVPPTPRTTVAVYWGTADGVDTAAPLTLALPNAITADVGDLDGDGHGDLAIAVHQGQGTTRASSYVYFGDGRRRAPSRIQPVPTTGGQGVRIARVRPGAPAVAVFSNSVQATLDSAVPIRMYWGSAGGFSTAAMTDIPNLGGYKSSASDLNHDGYVDLIVVNGGDASDENLSRADSAGVNIYWGGAEGAIHGPGKTRFDASRRQILPEPRPMGIDVADLNRDGYLDVVVGTSHHTLHPAAALSIYYGSAAGYRMEDRQQLVTRSDRQGVGLIADYNRDGWLDIVTTCFMTNQVITYWGSAEGFSESRAHRLLYPTPIDAETADLNGDGWLDLVTGSYIDTGSDRSDTGFSIFWGRPEGWSQSDSLWLPGMTPVGMAVADLDGDGYLDIVSPHYHGELTREQLPAYIYWGSAEGYNSRRRTALVLDSGHDAVLADFDHDGRLDIAFTAHSTDPGHELDSPIYFNDGNRFRNPRVQYLPVIGPHYMWEQDVGNIYHRRYEENFTSRTFTWDQARQGGTIRVDAATPFQARVRIQVRSAATAAELAAAAWTEAAGGRFALAPGHRALQYRLDLLSANGDAYPLVRRVEVRVE